MSDSKALQHFMDRCNNLQREAILLKSENRKLKLMLDHALQTVERLRDENRRTALLLGDTVSIEIDKLISDVGGC